MLESMYDMSKFSGKKTNFTQLFTSRTLKSNYTDFNKSIFDADQMKVILLVKTNQ